MSKRVPFDREKFINRCCKPCNDGRQLLLDKIEQYKESEPEMVQHLEWYRDRLWNDQVIEDRYRQMVIERGNDQVEKDAVVALRAMADKLEDQRGPHFMIRCELPPLPIFSGEDEIERYGSDISVTLVARPLGG